MICIKRMLFNFSIFLHSGRVAPPVITMRDAVRSHSKKSITDEQTFVCAYIFKLWKLKISLILKTLQLKP